MKIVNPATLQVIAEVAEDSPSMVAAKYARSRAAQPAWARTPLDQRLAAIRRFRDLLVANREELALVLTRETGKPVKQAGNELAAMPGRLDFFLGATAETLRDEVVWNEGTMEERIVYEPWGVVANISAWNYPYFVGSNVFVPALLAGNSVLYKPSEWATMTGQRIAALLHQAGVPEDVFITVVGGGPAGSALLEQPIDAVFFTGSHATGQKIAQAVAGRLLKVQLELGGKDPTYVCPDVDVAAAAEGLADGAFYNNGQSCCSVERIYVNREIAEPFLQAFAQTVSGFVVGDPEAPATYISPLARPEQLTVLEAQVKDALAKGARLLCGGKRADIPGTFPGTFEPTVLADVTGDMQVMREESFGPIIGIQTVADDEEAVRCMNDTAYGLTAGVYTQDRARAQRILARVDAGSVYWNCCDRVSPRLPWTGRKHSGMGSTLSTAGIRAFVQPKAWHLRAP
ncbi:MAG: aldehyde dehydrogenase family protein [Polyangia bacterium]